MLKQLYTPQGEKLSPTAWQSYPRPQMRRESYVNLNGMWEFAVSQDPQMPKVFEEKIRVPYCPESLLSGINREIKPGSYLFYRKEWILPPDFIKDRVLLHVGAADQITDIYVNQKKVCSHRGGYHSFSCDITDALAEENELIIRVYDDLRSSVLPYGKQSLNRGGMWYTPVSGIWQTVWAESVPVQYIEKLHIQADQDSVTISVEPVQAGRVVLDGKTYPLTAGSVTITPENKRLWSPEEPNLYDFSVVTETDRVESYFALRSIETKCVKGIPRLCLNGKPFFFHGLLDQGYWSDGIYTPVEEGCYDRDILEMKKLGFNTLRKHIKVEPEPFYYACDRLGMVVFQDMVNNGKYRFLRDTALPTIGLQKWNDVYLNTDEETRKAFLDSMEATVRQLKNHPCILYWTIFNEGWGQFCSDDAYEKLKKLDASRVIDTTSGWFRRKKSDVDSRHIYFSPWSTLKVGEKPLVLSEFGGYACPVNGHVANPQKAFGYKACKDPAQFQKAIEQLYLTKVLPAVQKGLCAAICTQISDVEDEINGFLTYDRRVNKGDPVGMGKIAALLQQAVE